MLRSAAQVCVHHCPSLLSGLGSVLFDPMVLFARGLLYEDPLGDQHIAVAVFKGPRLPTWYGWGRELHKTLGHKWLSLDLANYHCACSPPAILTPGEQLSHRGLGDRWEGAGVCVHGLCSRGAQLSLSLSLCP